MHCGPAVRFRDADATYGVHRIAQHAGAVLLFVHHGDVLAGRYAWDIQKFGFRGELHFPVRLPIRARLFRYGFIRLRFRIALLRMP